MSSRQKSGHGVIFAISDLYAKPGSKNMITLSELKTFLDNYLYFDKKMDIGKVDPIMTNGLMVRGKEEIKKIGFGVSASLSFFQKAKQLGCDALIVHHSFNYPPVNCYDGIFQNRISFLLKHNISLFGYHFLLDAHPEIGNNAQILKAIGAKPVKEYLHRGDPWGWIGEFRKGEELSVIEKKLKSYLSPRALIYRFGPEKIRRVVAVSGCGAPYSGEMQYLLAEGIDLFITGEVHEWNRENFREAKISFIAGGHYATEVFGVKALMEKTKDNFPDVAVEWLDLNNDI